VAVEHDLGNAHDVKGDHRPSHRLGLEQCEPERSRNISAMTWRHICAALVPRQTRTSAETAVDRSTSTSLPETRAATAGSARGDREQRPGVPVPVPRQPVRRRRFGHEGPFVTEPSAANRLPWHGHRNAGPLLAITARAASPQSRGLRTGVPHSAPDPQSETVQHAWGHIALNA
jgi:hypothetical protein